MKFRIFYEHQLPRPWNEGDEHRLFQEALDQVELADKLGIDYAWEVEHHFWRNIRTPLPRKYSLRPARSAPRTSVSAMASA
jgi:alkanesulfonate monooxygenase SsuD/methylene tetrahydromethanopterin reductase-like flavin-dependent oxidoreductase (luciferase family)